MTALSKELITEHIQLIFVFGLLAFFTHWFAKSRGFFTLPKPLEERGYFAQGRQVVCAFAIYLITALVIAPILGKIFMRIQGTNALSLASAGLLQLVTMALILLFLILYTATQNPVAMRQLWFGQDKPSSKRMVQNLCLGIVTWFVAFPLVVAVGQLCDLIIYLFFGVENYEQVAVRFLKMALASPYLLTIALVTIIAVAPVIEEWLFRGFLQSFFRKLVGSRAAIVLSAIAFALFHLSGSQGWGNLSLAVTLFTFSCYLGFLYERQGSLLAPIGLHMAFNMVSSIRILLMPTA